MTISLQSTQSRVYLLILTVMTVVISLVTFFHPLVISIDSIYGFLAYKGSLLTGSPNVIAEVSTENINQVNKHFVSWWSPGQWIFPGMLNYLFGVKLGMAMIIITVLSALSGLYGYYKVFRFFRFPDYISLISLLLIFCSSNFYYAFVIYQGGEILSFAVFPWFVLYLVSLERLTWKSFIMIALFYLLCFLAKTTMIIYCMIVLAYKPILHRVHNTVSETNVLGIVKSLGIFLPAIVCNIFIYLSFLTKGIKPTIVNQLHLSFQDLLVPLSSPVTSVLSIQQWITRAEKLFVVNKVGEESLLILFLYLLSFIAVVGAGILLYRQSNVERNYKLLLLLLYIGLSGFFIFSYAFDTNIDYSSRHFKQLGFLCLPGFVALLYQYLKHWLLFAAVSLFCIFAILDVAYIKNKWTADRFISENYIYRNYDNLEKKDSLDEITYRKLVEADRSMTGMNMKNAIFYIESNEDVELDMQHLCITQKPGEALYARIYQGKGPAVIACISKKTLLANPDLLRKKFPSYLNIKPMYDTRHYQFLLATNW